MISVVIATKNRTDKIKACIASLLQNPYKDFEIIIIDQSSSPKVRDNTINNPTKTSIMYFPSSTKGKSAALNLAIKMAKGSIIAVVDDDCIVDKYWLQKIDRYLSANQNIAGVFGNIIPYKKTQRKGYVCPSTFFSRDSKVINSRNTIHYHELGLGHNMALRKRVLKKIGIFKEWLGASSGIIGGAEESEYIFRILKNGFKLGFEPDIKIFHNRWITPQDELYLQGRYTAGLIAFYNYYLLTETAIMKKFISSRFNERIKFKITLILRMLRKFKIRSFYQQLDEFKYLLWESYCWIIGTCIGLHHFIVDLGYNKYKSFFKN